jgi:predicted HAD superfamily Cof-like phosphohydrolase
MLALQHARRFSKHPVQASRGPRPGDAFGEGDVALAVLAFHEAFGLPRQAMPSAADVTAELADLRVRLQREETDELAEAVEAGDVVAVADALADLVYVAYGTAITYGIDLDAVLAEVHRSNMSKLDSDGRPVMREDGKVLKSRWYTPPDVGGVLKQQLPLPLAW